MEKRFAEFFAGIGLVHRGLIAGRWECVYANDIEQKKQVMYEGEFGSAPYFHLEDIWQADRVVDAINSPPFLATASFPCTDLSLAGHWRGLDGAHSSTYFGFVDVLKKLGGHKPSIVMLENVTGFLTSRNGEDFKAAVCALSELGYWIDAIVLDAKWFVPQSRPRTFVFGFHESLVSPLIHRRPSGLSLDHDWGRAVERSALLRPNPLPKLYDSTDLSTGWAAVDFIQPPQTRYALADVIDTDDSQDWWDAGATAKHLEMMESPSRQRVENALASGGPMVGAAFRRTRRGKTRFEVRFDLAGCLRTPKGGSAKQIVVVIEQGCLRMRWMSAVEYARLQGAGDYNITVPTTQAMYGFGDAVCVPAIEWIDRQILTPVYESVLAVPVSSSSASIRPDKVAV